MVAQASACGLFLLAPFLLQAQNTNARMHIGYGESGVGEFHGDVVGQQLDPRSVVSPNGQIEFRVFVGQPSGALWSRLGFEISYKGKPVLAQSWIGLDFYAQEPFLGENAGLMSSDSGSNAAEHYNYLVAHYMQNGTLGRKIDVEARAYDDGIAFRYFIPLTNPVAVFLLRDELTQFNFAQPGVLDHLPKEPDFDLPFVVEEPGVGWVAIAESRPAGNSSIRYPATYLIRSGDGMRTNLPRSTEDPEVAFTGKTPLAWIWRMVLIDPDRERLLGSDIAKNLDH
jgi:alpha-glucosidase